MSINGYSIPDVVSFVIAASAAIIFYCRYFKNRKNRFSELLIANILLLSAFTSLNTYFLDNIVPVGVPARSVPNAANKATWLLSSFYPFCSMILASILHFMFRYFRVKNAVSENISLVYGLAAFSSALFFTPLFVRKPESPLSEYSGWANAIPWLPQLSVFAYFFIALWVIVFFFVSHIIWKQQKLQLYHGEFRLSRSFFQAVFTIGFGGGFFDMIAGICNHNIVSVAPYSVAIIALCFLFRLLINRRIQSYAFISYTTPDKDFVDRLKIKLQQNNIAYFDFNENTRNLQVRLNAEIRTQIREAEAFICVISDSWEKSNWTPKEYKYARDCNVNIFQIIAKPMTRPLPNPIKHFHCLNSDEKGVQTLLDELLRIIKKTKPKNNPDQ